MAFELLDDEQPTRTGGGGKGRFELLDEPAPDKRTRSQKIAQGIGDTAAGLIRGAGSIGATILAPVDMAKDALDGKGFSLESNRERRAAMDGALGSMGADTDSWAYKGGKFAGELAGTAGAGSVLAAPVQAASAARWATGLEPLLTGAAQALRTGGFRAGELAGTGAGTAARALGGAVTGGVTAGAINPDEAFAGAVMGGGLPFVAQGAGRLASAAGNMLPEGVKNLARRVTSPVNPQALEAQIDITLERAGLNPADITEGMRRALRAEMENAMRAGREVDPVAMGRLADFRSTGIAPTRGMLTQDAAQITREQNLAKMGVQGDGPLQGLAQLQNANNTAMIRNLNELGAGRGDTFRAGQNAMDSILARDAELGSGVRGAYDRAKGVAGGDIELERKPIIDGIFEALARENKMAFLPDDIGRTLNEISLNQSRRGGEVFPVPFNPRVVDNLKTMMSTAQRSTQDGNQKMALGLARQVLEDAPFNVVRPPAAPGQLVNLADAGAGPAAGGANEAAAPYMSALNDARTMARERFGWQDSSRVVRSVLGDTPQPDKLFKENVLSGTVADTREFMRYAGPEETRSAVMGYLRDKALSSQPDETAKFSSAALNRALREIGDRKLEAIFPPVELARLRSLARASSLAQAQPAGSAVNNSNSGALVLGRMVDGVLSNKIPVIGPNIGVPLRNIQIGIQQRQAQDLAPVLMRPGTTQRPLGPAARGLMTAVPVWAAQDQ